MEKIIKYLENVDLNIMIGGININIINFAKLEAGSDWSVMNHCHSDFEFHIIPSGRGHINIEDTELIVNKGEFYITGPYVMHSQVSDSEMPMEEYCLECEINIGNTSEEKYIASVKENQLLKDTFYTTYPCIFKDSCNAINIFEEIIKENEEKAPGYFLNIQSLVIKLIISIMRSVIKSTNSGYKYAIPLKSLDSFRINRIINFVEINYKRNISLKDVSKVLFLSPRQINRVMLKELSMTFHDYLLNHRLIIAKKLIYETDMTIEKIAYEAGFSSHYYMYQVFKHMGIPAPGTLR